MASPTPRRSAAGIFQRIFEKGLVLVNPTKAAITVALKDTMHLVTLARPPSCHSAGPHSSFQKPFEFISVGQQNDSAGPYVGHTIRRWAGWNGRHCASGRQPRVHRDQVRGGPAELRSDYANLRTAWSQRGRCIHLPVFKGCHQLANRSQKLIDSTPTFHRTQNLSAWRTDVRIVPCRSSMAMGEKLISSRVPAQSTLIL